MASASIRTGMAGQRGNKRSGKFYSRNEKKTLMALGLTPAPASGAGWVIKEDGENDVVMVQLKSTDASSYRLNMLDMKKLEYHAMVSSKVPVFLVQFLKQDKLYAIVDIADLQDLHRALETGEAPSRVILPEAKETESSDQVTHRRVRASPKAREEFFKERREKFGTKR